MRPEEELANLQDKLAARTDRAGNDKPGYGESNKLIRERIAELEAEGGED